MAAGWSSSIQAMPKSSAVGDWGSAILGLDDGKLSAQQGVLRLFSLPLATLLGWTVGNLRFSILDGNPCSQEWAGSRLDRLGGIEHRKVPAFEGVLSVRQGIFL